MGHDVDSFLVRLVVVLLSLAVGIAVYNWKNLPQPIRILSLFLGWNLSIEAITFLLPKGTNNLPLLHLYTLLEFILFTFVYQKMNLFKNWPDHVVKVYTCGVVAAIILNSIFLQSIFEFNTYAKTGVQIILIIYAIGFIFQLRGNTVESGYQNLLNAAVLIFYSGSLFIFMFGNIMVRDGLDIVFWEINLLLNLLFQILIIISLWKASRIRKLQF